MSDNESDFKQRRSKRTKMTLNVPVPDAAHTEASDPVDDLTARMPSGTQCSTITYHSRQCKLAAAAKTHSHSCSDDSYEQASPFLFTGFTAAYAYMHDEFAVKGCDGMTLIDRGGDATKWAVVYRYACAYHNYVKCPFVIRIRIVVVCHVPLPACVWLPLLSLCFPSPRDAASTFCPLALSSHFLSLSASHCLCHSATLYPSLSFSLCIQPP